MYIYTWFISRFLRVLYRSHIYYKLYELLKKIINITNVIVRIRVIRTISCIFSYTRYYVHARIY